MKVVMMEMKAQQYVILPLSHEILELAAGVEVTCQEPVEVQWVQTKGSQM